MISFNENPSYYFERSYTTTPKGPVVFRFGKPMVTPWHCVSFVTFALSDPVTGLDLSTWSISPDWNNYEMILTAPGDIVLVP